MTKEYSEEEVTEMVLGHIKVLIEHWEHESRAKTVGEKLEGLAFSILTMIDGSTNLPRFILAPDPHPDDKEYNIDNEEDYFPENQESNVVCDISGCLHELFYKK